MLDTMTLKVPQDLDQTKRERLAVALFDAQLLTQAQAAEMTGLSRVEFFDLLGHLGVSPMQYDWDDAWVDALAMEGQEELGSR